MEKTKNIFIGMIALVMLFAMIGVVSAAETITWTNPTSASAYLTIAAVESQSMLNITTAGNLNISSCNFTYSASDTNQTAAMLIGTNSTTANATLWTVKVNATQFEDTNNGLLTAACFDYNVSAASATATQAVRIDGAHTPTAPTSVRPTNNYIASQDTTTVSFSGTVTAADATGCYIQFSGANPGSTIYAKNNLSATGTNCTITVANFPEGTYKVQFFATDGTNVTVGNGAGNLFTVEYAKGSYGTIATQSAIQQGQPLSAVGDGGAASVVTTGNSKPATTFILIIAAIVVITKIMKKGGRRR